MRYAPTIEQREFQHAVRQFLQERVPESSLPDIANGTDRFDRRLWVDMATQLELQGIAVPEELDGSGAGQFELGIVVEELGRALVPTPYFASVVLALPLIRATGGGASSATWVRDIVSGSSIVSAALAETGRPAGTSPTVRASTSGQLTGTKTLVMDGDLADAFVVSARDADDRTGLYLVTAHSPGVAVHPQQMLDPTRGSAELRLDSTPASRLDLPGDAETVVAQVLTGARVALCFEQLGGAARCLEIAVDHANSREQFGRPIASFQAVKHMCADVLCDVEAARSAAWYAAWALDRSSDELPTVAHSASYICSEAYTKAARVCVHVLGGIGFTWDHPAQLFFKRATSDAQLFGSATDELMRLADGILPEPAAQGHPS